MRKILSTLFSIVVGIDIPDYISSGGGASDAIKSMSSKLKALGKRRRR